MHFIILFGIEFDYKGLALPSLAKIVGVIGLIYFKSFSQPFYYI